MFTKPLTQNYKNNKVSDKCIAGHGVMRFVFVVYCHLFIIDYVTRR